MCIAQFLQWTKVTIQPLAPGHGMEVPLHGLICTLGSSDTCRCDIAPFASLVWEGYMGAQVRHHLGALWCMSLLLQTMLQVR